MHGSLIAIAFASALASQTVAISNPPHVTALPKGARIACRLQTPVDSRTARVGETFELYAVDPTKPELRGAVIDGYVTDVTKPRGLVRARIGFLFSSIKFLNGMKEPIHAYVVSQNVVERNTARATPRPPGQAPGMSSAFAPSRSTIVFEMQLGPKTVPAGQTGGYIYAQKSGGTIHITKGTPVTVALTSRLQIP
ncbi:MAG: hypothetical protein ACYDGM_14555 [Vulcanimicrobiaceae bacterium]